MAMDTTTRITNLLSMAQRAGRIVSGAFATEKAVKERKARLLLIATDASEETKQNYQILADRYAIPCQEHSRETFSARASAKSTVQLQPCLMKGLRRNSVRCSLMEES